jgi:ribosome-associated protein
VTNIQTNRNDAVSSYQSNDDRQSSRQVADWALEAALGKKALEPVLLDVTGLCSYTEYLLVVSGRSTRQVDAIAEAIHLELKKRGRTAMGLEGKNGGNWALLDYGDVVIHVFHHPQREHYDLESLWIEASRVEIAVPPSARMTIDDMY